MDSIDGKITACNTGAVAGSVTANAGTNLNTSALATETTLGTVHGHVDSIDGKITACNTGAVVVSSGAITETNSGSIKTAVEIMDDWDDGADHCEVVNPYKPAISTETGTGALSKSIAITAPSILKMVEMKLSAVPTTGAQPITVTKDSVTGAAYDVLHYSQDLVAAASTSFCVRFDPPIDFFTGDAIVVAFANTNGVTYGLTVTTQIV